EKRKIPGGLGGQRPPLRPALHSTKQSATYLVVTTVYSATGSTPENDAPHESCDVYPFVNRDDRGQPGDLLIAMGRWIIDCGHTDYASEIHPPSILGNI